MNTPAIYQSIRLINQPEEMAWLCFPDSDLPEGINDLLRISASEEKLIDFAETNGIDSEELRFAVFNFIEQAMLNSKNSNEKILGVGKFANSQSQKFHFELLIKIYQPETSLRPNADHYFSLISKAYEELQKTNSDQGVISFSEYRKPQKTYKPATQKANTHPSFTKTAIAMFSAVAIFSLVAMTGKFYGSLTPELANDNIVEADSDIQNAVKVTSLKSKISFVEKQPPIKASSSRLQALLKDIEVAYEKGDIDTIKPLLANAPEIKDQTDKQLNDKLETIFEITSERKMVLFNFNWKSASGLLEGKGKFISRYQLVGEKKWLTREGNALVSATKVDGELKITQLILENQPIE